MKDQVIRYRISRAASRDLIALIALKKAANTWTGKALDLRATEVQNQRVPLSCEIASPRARPAPDQGPWASKCPWEAGGARVTQRRPGSPCHTVEATGGACPAGSASPLCLCPSAAWVPESCRPLVSLWEASVAQGAGPTGVRGKDPWSLPAPAGLEPSRRTGRGRDHGAQWVRFRGRRGVWLRKKFSWH